MTSSEYSPRPHTSAWRCFIVSKSTGGYAGAPASLSEHNGGVRVTAKADYAVRALLELTVADEGPAQGRANRHRRRTSRSKFLENILIDLRHAGIVRAQRGADGGYWLARPASDVTVGDVIRAVEGPLASVRGEPPEDVDYRGAAEPLRTVWVALRASMREVVDELTLADVAADRMPAAIKRLTEPPDAWSRRYAQAAAPSERPPGPALRLLECLGRKHARAFRASQTHVTRGQLERIRRPPRVSWAEIMFPPLEHQLHANLEAEQGDPRDHCLLGARPRGPRGS